jgi:ribose transport system permease protein
MSALLAALAGLLFSGISGSVGPDQTNSYLLPSVAAAVIGGTSILGGVGGYTGTILGALILTVLNRLLLTLDTTEAFRQILYGLIVLALAWVYVRLTGQRGV